MSMHVHDMDDEAWVRQAELNIWDLANGAEGMTEKLDKEDNVHMLRYKKPPDLEANKLILKNKSKGKWADKIEISSTQININLTAGYNEVNQLMEQQRLLVEESKSEIIDVEIIKE